MGIFHDEISVVNTLSAKDGDLRLSASAKDGDFRLCDGMCVFHIHMLQTTYIHIAWCAIQLERRNVPHYSGIKQ